MVETAIEEISGTKVLQVKAWDLLPSNLFTHSVLNVVYETISRSNVITDRFSI